MLKVRTNDTKDADIPATFAVLTKDRLSYFLDPKDETSVEGSFILAEVITPITLIDKFPSCFSIKTKTGEADGSLCTESKESAKEWINSISQNIVNCNKSEE
mmetsp:Transcript_27282/g.31481  ORF Transcript_27282/g.31481 Transcript_27282/m.31481 type:complete len:102 (+) Transcript_27282:314-619(+)